VTNHAHEAGALERGKCSGRGGTIEASDTSQARQREHNLTSAAQACEVPKLDGDVQRLPWQSHRDMEPGKRDRSHQKVFPVCRARETGPAGGHWNTCRKGELVFPHVTTMDAGSLLNKQEIDGRELVHRSCCSHARVMARDRRV
jgi:hypothetical protein